MKKNNKFKRVMGSIDKHQKGSKEVGNQSKLKAFH